LENSGKQLDYYIDAFHKLSGISKALFGEELSGNDSGYARRLALMGLQKGIEARRARYAHAFVTVLRAAMEIERLFGLATVEPIERLTIEWASVVPSDTASEEQRVVQQAQSGVRSLRSSVKLLNPLFTDEEITAEVNCIIDEQAAIRRVAVMMPDGASSE
jgi:hypothetical protein